MSLREDQVVAAVRFLNQARVASRPQAEKEDFLKRKGLTNEEIAEAVKRAKESHDGYAEAGGATSQHPVVAPSSAQPQWPAHSGQPQQPPYAPSSTAGWQTNGSGGIGPAGVPAYQPMPAIPPWAFMPPPEPAPTPGWAWVLAGLGGAGVGFGLSSLLSMWKQKSGPHPNLGVPPVQHALPLGVQTLDAAALQPPSQGAAYPLENVALNSVTEDADNALRGKAAYEELVELLRKQGEERAERDAYHSKVVKEMQEQNKQLVGEMQKLLQQQMQHQKALMGKPAELSSTSIRQLAEILQPAAASSTGTPSAVPCGGSNTPPVAGGAPALAGGVMPLRESFDAIGQSLQRLVRESPSKEQVAKSLQTMSMILQNLLSNPSSEKHRKVNSSSDRFRVLLGQNSAASELLKLAGFQYQEPNFIFAPDVAGGVETAAATRVRDLVKEAQANLDHTWANRAAPTPPATAGGDMVGNEAPASQETVANVVSGPLAGAGCLEEDNVSAGRAVAVKPWASNLGSMHGMSTPAAPSVASAAVTTSIAAASTNSAPAADDVAQRQEVVHAVGPSSPSSSGTGTVPQATPTMAHPAESQEWNNPGPAIAHPAESDALPQVARPAIAHQSGPPRTATPPLPQATVAVAHPAESSQVSGEPQSGG